MGLNGGRRRVPLSGWRTEPVVADRVVKAREARAEEAKMVAEAVVLITGAVADGEGKAPGRVRQSPRPSYCTRYVKGRVAQDLPVIVDELLKKSKKGDAAALKALWQMAQLDQQKIAVNKRKSGLARELLERLK